MNVEQIRMIVRCQQGMLEAIDVPPGETGRSIWYAAYRLKRVKKELATVIKILEESPAYKRAYKTMGVYGRGIRNE